MKERWTNRSEEYLTQLRTFTVLILQQVLFGWMRDRNRPDMQHVSRKQMHTKYRLENSTNQLEEHVTHERIILKQFLNKLFGFNNLTRESSGRLQQSGESGKSITTWVVWHSWVVFWRRSCTLPIVCMMSHDVLAPSWFCTLQLWWLESMWDDDSHDKT